MVFDVPGIGSVTATRKSAQSFEYDANVSFATPPAGTPFTIRVKVDDGDGQHLVELPIDIDLVGSLEAGLKYLVMGAVGSATKAGSFVHSWGRSVRDGSTS